MEEIEIYDTVPENAVPLPNGWWAADLGEGLWEIFDSDGVPIGLIKLDGDILDYSIDYIEANMVKINPKTGDMSSMIFIGLLILMAASVAVWMWLYVSKKRKKAQ